MRQLGGYLVARDPRHECPEANQKALWQLFRGSDHGAMPVQDRQVEVAVRGASHPLAHANACHAVLACDLVDVDTALGGRDCGEDILYVVGLPWQSVARQDSFPCVTGSTACQAHVNVLETGCGLEPALKPAVGQYEVAAATPGAALAVQNRVAAARQGGLILARLDCKYVNHHVPLDGPGEQQLSWFGAVSLFRGRRRYVLGPSPSWVSFQAMSVAADTIGTSRLGPAAHRQATSHRCRQPQPTPAYPPR